MAKDRYETIACDENYELHRSSVVGHPRVMSVESRATIAIGSGRWSRRQAKTPAPRAPERSRQLASTRPPRRAMARPEPRGPRRPSSQSSIGRADRGSRLGRIRSSAASASTTSPTTSASSGCWWPPQSGAAPVSAERSSTSPKARAVTAGSARCSSSCSSPRAWRHPEQGVPQGVVRPAAATASPDRHAWTTPIRTSRRCSPPRATWRSTRSHCNPAGNRGRSQPEASDERAVEHASPRRRGRAPANRPGGAVGPTAARARSGRERPASRPRRCRSRRRRR